MQANPIVPDLNGLDLFDSCVTLGRFPGGCIESADELLSLMDRYRIREALVHDYHARSVVPISDGNERLMRAIAGHERLHPVWVMAPPDEPGAEAAERAVTTMLESGVRAARLCLRRLSPVEWVWRDLLSRFEAHRVPVFLDFGPVWSTVGELKDYDADAVYKMAESHPKLPVVLSRVMGGLGVHPAVMPMLRRLPNVYIDIAGILDYWRKAAVEISPERVLFATGAPFTDPGILVNNVQYAMEIKAADKKLICGDNLRRLLGGVI